MSQFLQFVCNDLLWSRDLEKTAKILMRCQTTHLYSIGVANTLLHSCAIFSEMSWIFCFTFFLILKLFYAFSAYKCTRYH